MPNFVQTLMLINDISEEKNNAGRNQYPPNSCSEYLNLNTPNAFCKNSCIE